MPETAATPTKPAGLKSLALATSPNFISTSLTSNGVLSNAALNCRSVVVPPTHPSGIRIVFSSGFADQEHLLQLSNLELLAVSWASFSE
jgi:hypothetical protein